MVGTAALAAAVSILFQFVQSDWWSEQLLLLLLLSPSSFNVYPRDWLVVGIEGNDASLLQGIRMDWCSNIVNRKCFPSQTISKANETA